MQIFIIALEPLETRYTGQWYHGIPNLLKRSAVTYDRDIVVHNVAGDQTSTATTEGAFLNFAATNIWKNSQINKVAEWFQMGKVKAGDKFLFTDAWHPGVIQVKYMSELLNVPVEIHSMWHAGSYDPQDFLGRLIKDKNWTLNFERSVFHASDYNYFATEFHADLFRDVVLWEGRSFDCKFVRSGQPHSALVDSLMPFAGKAKKRQILFPHRLAPEKQPEIFRDLASAMPDVDFIVCQEKSLTKDEYHTLLAESMIVFSANLQETLGISAMEGVLVGTFPYVPNRLSYSEMYKDVFKYPSDWTIDNESYKFYREEIIQDLYSILNNFQDFKKVIDEQREVLLDDYLSAGPMITNLLRPVNTTY